MEGNKKYNTLLKTVTCMKVTMGEQNTQQQKQTPKIRQERDSGSA